MPSRFSGRCRAAASAASRAGHDPLGVLRTQLAGSPGTRRPAFVSGRDLDRCGDRDRSASGHPAHAATGVAGPRVGHGERVPDGAEPRPVRIPHPAPVHRRHRRDDGDRGAGPLRALANRSQHLRGGRRRGPGGARGGAGHGHDRLAAAHTGRITARLRRDPGRRARRDCRECRHGDHCSGHRRGRAGRLHLPRRGCGGRHPHSRRGAAGGADGARGGWPVGRGGAAVRVAREMSPHPLSPSPFGRGGTPGRPRWSLGLVVLLLTGCAQRDRIVVGSKNFTESDLLGELVAQQIARRTGLPVERRFHLGGTFVCHQAITSGQIDLYVEYTGTAYTAVLKHAPVADRDSVYRTVARDYAQRFTLVWGKPLGFDNTFAITVRQRDATRYGLKRISDLTRVAPRWKAGFGYEFLEGADGFRGLASVYGLRFASPPTAMDLGLTYRALAQGKVDVIAGNSTDGQIQALDLVVLEDDRHYFPPYEAAPVIRQAVITRYAGVAAALDPLAGRISDAEMRRLNALADVEHRDIATIARDWLRASLP